MPAAGGIEACEELEALSRRVYALWGTEQWAEVFSRIVSDDPSLLMIGTDEAEWFVGKEVNVAVDRVQASEIAEISPLVGVEVDEIHAWRLGAAGWVAARVRLLLSDATEIASRETLIFHLDGIDWRLVHGHRSIGTPNEVAYGRTLTTTIEEIASAVSASRPDLSASTALDGTVTIAFTDIEASTEIAERLGDARWLELLRWHDREVRRLATRHAGTVVKSQGDGYMVAFASATGALNFAVDLEAACDSGYEGESVRVRIGVNAGDVIKEREDFFGHAVTVASRVAAKARGGEVLVTDLVAGLVAGADHLRFGPSREEHLKGIADLQVVRPLLLLS